MISSYFPLSKTAAVVFEDLYELMLSSPVNVTAIKSKEDYYIKHILDSIYVFSDEDLLDISKIATVIDIGSGGGFPGIPMAVCFPHLKVTLVDSIAKKCRYLEDTVNSLGLSNVEVINSRAENLSGSYDLATARGVGTIKEVYNYTHKLVKKGWLMYKGEKLGQEMEEFHSVYQKRRLKSAVKRIETPFTRSYFYMYY